MSMRNQRSAAGNVPASGHAQSDAGLAVTPKIENFVGLAYSGGISLKA
jgi:hypothetical protein